METKLASGADGKGDNTGFHANGNQLHSLDSTGSTVKSPPAISSRPAPAFPQNVIGLIGSGLSEQWPYDWF